MFLKYSLVGKGSGAGLAKPLSWVMLNLMVKPFTFFIIQPLCIRAVLVCTHIWLEIPENMFPIKQC